MILRFPIQRFGKLLTVLVVLFAVLHLTSLLFHASLDNRITELLVEKFSFDLERNFPTFFSALLLFLSSLLFFLIAWADKHNQAAKRYKFWMGLGLAFLFLSTDEAAHIHEHFDTEFIWGAYKTSGLLAWPWVIIYGGLSVLFAAGYFNFWRQIPGSFKWYYLATGCTYVFSALGFEMLEALEYSTHQGTYTFKYYVLTSLEEFFEMSAIALLVYTNMRYLATIYPQTSFSFSEDPIIYNVDAVDQEKLYN